MFIVTHFLLLCLQDKILQSMGRGQEVMVTNDGATILKSLYVDNPAAKVLVGERPLSCLSDLGKASSKDKISVLISAYCDLDLRHIKAVLCQLQGLESSVQGVLTLFRSVQTSQKHRMQRLAMAQRQWWSWLGSCCGRQRSWSARRYTP